MKRTAIIPEVFRHRPRSGLHMWPRAAIVVAELRCVQVAEESRKSLNQVTFLFRNDRFSLDFGKTRSQLLERNLKIKIKP